ncbi:hypothetical protein PEX1_071190 [Penicillium expansum]|uniref:DUF7514 domain-containing protein n=1 Tax=Penicillium expansum TaxID=27334 RepID=A0A0A2J7E1_PENEN|nr:hypothetical protein PEX2_022980 [Penicillium expansum]KGO48290.1 hypothetical protein PEXP_041100 [Penicillium expansum]KGO53770.1 hypothetical protein PEX2_022980 [Penicillium expansum]KGO68048.1 hypothetical protein PEX1_071190 [Penicillium expansum]
MASADIHWGTLINSDKSPAPLLEQLCLGIAQLMSTFDTNISTDITPERIATFYRKVGGNYDPLFLETKGQALSFIYQSLGCFHSLQPSANPYEPPSIPSLLPNGFVRWQTIQLLMDPDEHSVYLQNAVNLWDIPDANGETFPKTIPRDAFPSEPDPEMLEWHEGTLGHITTILVERILYLTKMTTSPVHVGRHQSVAVMRSPIGPATIAITAEITAENIQHFLHVGLERTDRVFQPREFHPLPHGESVQHIQADETKMSLHATARTVRNPIGTKSDAICHHLPIVVLDATPTKPTPADHSEIYRQQVRADSAAGTKATLHDLANPTLSLRRRYTREITQGIIQEIGIREITQRKIQKTVLDHAQQVSNSANLYSATRPLLQLLQIRLSIDRQLPHHQERYRDT